MNKKIKSILSISIIINLLLISAGGFVIHKKGGVKWINNKVISFLNKDKKDNTDFPASYYTKKSIFDEQENNSNAIVFLGDSLTDNYDWCEAFKNVDIQNRGISSDTTDGVLNRLDTIINEKPKEIFIMIGTNDLGNGKSVEYIVENYKTILGKINLGCPETKIFIQGVLPTNKTMTGNGMSSNNNIIDLNNILRKLENDNIKFINLHDSFLDDKNELNEDYTYDGVHLNGKGYEIWTDSIKDYVQE